MFQFGSIYFNTTWNILPICLSSRTHAHMHLCVRSISTHFHAVNWSILNLLRLSQWPSMIWPWYGLMLRDFMWLQYLDMCDANNSDACSYAGVAVLNVATRHYYSSPDSSYRSNGIYLLTDSNFAAGPITTFLYYPYCFPLADWKLLFKLYGDQYPCFRHHALLLLSPWQLRSLTNFAVKQFVIARWFSIWYEWKCFVHSSSTSQTVRGGLKVHTINILFRSSWSSFLYYNTISLNAFFSELDTRAGNRNR
jgi:hypothetical protein